MKKSRSNKNFVDFRNLNMTIFYVLSVISWNLYENRSADRFVIWLYWLNYLKGNWTRNLLMIIIKFDEYSYWNSKHYHDMRSSQLFHTHNYGVKTFYQTKKSRVLFNISSVIYKYLLKIYLYNVIFDVNRMALQYMIGYLLPPPT